MTLLDEILKGESRRIEFKRQLSSLGAACKTAVSFANSGGGKLIFGIEDKTKKIIGVSSDQLDNWRDKVTNSLFDSISPKLSFEIFTVAIGKQNLLVVEIFPSLSLPHYIKSLGSKSGVFIRVGSTTRLADNEIICELERQRINISYDEEVAYGFSVEDISLEELKRYLGAALSKKIKMDDLINLQIVKKDRHKLVPTVGGVLLAGKKPIHSNAYISCALFKGTTAEIFLDRKELKGHLYEQIEEAMLFIKKHIPLRGKIEGLKRKDTYEVPLIALRESIVNAVIHRDYSISGSHIKIAIFDDLIEIISPGVLPKSMEIEDITRGRSEVRNKVISRFFKEINFIEQWGTGITKIFESCKNAQLLEPRFEETGLFFKVTLYRTKSQLSKPQVSTISFTPQEQRILEYLDNQPYIKNAQAQELLKLSSSRVREIFDSLLSKNLIQAGGKGKGRFYFKN